MSFEEPTFKSLCDLFKLIEGESSRLIKIDLYTAFLRQIKLKETLISALYLSSNLIFPQYENQEMNIGDSILIKVVAEYRGVKISKIRDELREKGDLGTLVMLSNVKPLFIMKRNFLTITEIHKCLKDICKASGLEANKAKTHLIFECIKRTVSGIERKYLFRFLEGNLKIGLALQTLLVCVSNIFSEKSCVFFKPQNIENEKTREGFSSQNNEREKTEEVTKKLKSEKESEKQKDKNKTQEKQNEKEESNEKDSHKKENEEVVKTAYNRTLSFELLIDSLINYGLSDLLKHCNVTPGIPLKPMLARACKGVGEIFEKIEDETFIAEYKYDGERIQIHKKGNKIGLFSRNCENLISKYPDLEKTVLNLNQNDFILDCEVVAYDLKKNEILPFQVLSTRKRKVENISDIKIDICIFCFDILFFKKSVIENILVERRKILFENFNESINFRFVKYKFCVNEEEVNAFFKLAMEEKAEGLMIKKLNVGSEYLPSKRTHNWLKLKKDYLNGLNDTLDLLVLGAYYGKGKRTGWYGGFLLGSYNDVTERFESVCKIGTGFSEELLEKFKNELKRHLSTDKPAVYLVSDKIKPDVWFVPQFVWEIKAAEYSLSPIYDSGRINLNIDRGISLRFPRFLRERNDKNVYESTTSETIYQNYINRRC
ncbi:DNA ligase 1 [Cucumispora dikerogammari]|nr:DNA ligase 1 [Cucumispora dikerogammari]